MNLLAPGLFLAGSLLVAGPVIIHLLNRRRFKRLDWAAMDFLLEANRRSRRRIRLEDLLLLLLRCLAVVLIALLVARPYWARDASGGWLDTVRYQRIVVLDNSLSMLARDGGATLFDNAKQAVADLAEKLAASRSGDALSLVVTSQPQTPVVAVDGLSDTNLSDVLDQIRQLEPSARPARFAEVLVAVRESLAERSAQPNRIVYVVTDLRQRDWTQRTTADPAAAVGDEQPVETTEQPEATAERAGDQQGSLAALRDLAEETAGCFVVDFGQDQTANLVLSRVVPKDRVLAAGVPAQFDIEVRNFGDQPVGDLEIRFTAEGSLPVVERMDSAPAKSVAVASINYAFPPPPEDEDVTPAPVPIQVQLSTASSEDDDLIDADNSRFFAARVVRGIRTLIVDGDPAPSPRRSESYYLRKALSPPGEAVAGIDVQVAGPSEFETVELDEYQAVFLCNLENISPPRRETLETWVRGGGGLVVAPGDQLYDPSNFNQQLYRDGQGLSPVRLDHLAGSESEQQWVNLTITAPDHDVVRLYAGENNPLLELIKIFRWWNASLPDDVAARDRASVLARFTDDEKSPAMVEQKFGKGRVVTIATPLDTDWSNWPQEPAGSIFVAAMQDLTRYVARATANQGEIEPGRPLFHGLDLSKFQRAVSLLTPDGQRQPLQAVPMSGDEGQASAAVDRAVWQVRFDETDEAGFYRLDLQRIDGRPQSVLFAANVDGMEGDLTQADRALLAARLEGSKIEIVGSSQLADLGASNVRSELWQLVAGIIACVLCAELILGWWLGRIRT